MKILSVMTYDPAVAYSPPTEKEIERMSGFIEEMKASGVLIDTGGRMPQMLSLRVSRQDGDTRITDGPFTEAKEVIGGFALLEVKDRDHAIEVTKRFLDYVGNATCHLHEVDQTP